jgi:hypothetical protein
MGRGGMSEGYKYLYPVLSKDITTEYQIGRKFFRFQSCLFSHYDNPLKYYQSLLEYS